jgi:hypothetical protein
MITKLNKSVTLSDSHRICLTCYLFGVGVHTVGRIRERLFLVQNLSIFYLIKLVLGKI